MKRSFLAVSLAAFLFSRSMVIPPPAHAFVAPVVGITSSVAAGLEIAKWSGIAVGASIPLMAVGWGCSWTECGPWDLGNFWVGVFGVSLLAFLAAGVVLLEEDNGAAAARFVAIDESDIHGLGVNPDDVHQYNAEVDELNLVSENLLADAIQAGGADPAAVGRALHESWAHEFPSFSPGTQAVLAAKAKAILKTPSLE